MVYKAYRQKPKPEPRSGACVYDIVLNGEVIYVGMTTYPKKRLGNHRSSGIAPEGSSLIVHKWYSTREEAFLEEHLRQMELKPIYCRESYKCDSDGFALNRVVSEEGPDSYRVISINDPDRFERMAEQERLRSTGKAVYLKPWMPNQ